jgi:hypothetical protein
MTAEDIADWEDLVHDVVNYKVCELAIVLQLLVATIINPHHVYIRTQTSDNINDDFHQ